MTSHQEPRVSSGKLNFSLSLVNTHSKVVIMPDPKRCLPLIPAQSKLSEVQKDKKWIDFVKRRRSKWQRNASLNVCSCHFAPEIFTGEIRVWCGQQAVRPHKGRDCSFPQISKEIAERRETIKTKPSPGFVTINYGD